MCVVRNTFSFDFPHLGRFVLFGMIAIIKRYFLWNFIGLAFQWISYKICIEKWVFCFHNNWLQYRFKQLYNELISWEILDCRLFILNYSISESRTYIILSIIHAIKLPITHTTHKPPSHINYLPISFLQSEARWRSCLARRRYCRTSCRRRCWTKTFARRPLFVLWPPCTSATPFAAALAPWNTLLRVSVFGKESGSVAVDGRLRFEENDATMKNVSRARIDIYLYIYRGRKEVRVYI